MSSRPPSDALHPRRHRGSQPDMPSTTGPDDAASLSQSSGEAAAREHAVIDLPSDHERHSAAAQTIQRTYRGYRERRQLKGHGLEASARWKNTLEDAQYHHATEFLRQPRPSVEHESLSPEERTRSQSDAARQNWKRVGAIARHAAGGNNGSDDEGSSAYEGKTQEEIDEMRRKREKIKREREKSAKMMDLQYWLEMVDSKHRYGSNLRAYHNEWKKADTNENFFYWLDEGQGRDIELPTVSRERLEREQVRYLTREERLNYLVKVDDEGRLCWAKNGQRISTNMDWKDSINGVVPVDENAPTYGDGGAIHYAESLSSSSSSSSSRTGSSISTEAERYVNYDLNKAKGVGKITHVSAAALLNHLLRKTVKPNTWIFVADTSFRLYVGIKQSGAFQHSSFLHGARISAAGLIKIKDGQLRRLSPLSGHYRPPAANFRAFVHSLRDSGVDMSRVSISRSYAVLVGLETYVRTRRKLKQGVEKMEEEAVGVVNPEEKRRRQESRIDKSKSAEKERQILAEKARKEEAAKKEKRKSFMLRFWRRLKKRPESSSSGSGNDKKKQLILSDPDRDVESGIPPEGKR